MGNRQMASDSRLKVVSRLSNQLYNSVNRDCKHVIFVQGRWVLSLFGVDNFHQTKTIDSNRTLTHFWTVFDHNRFSFLATGCETKYQRKSCAKLLIPIHPIQPLSIRVISPAWLQCLHFVYQVGSRNRLCSYRVGDLHILIIRLCHELGVSTQTVSFHQTLVILSVYIFTVYLYLYMCIYIYVYSIYVY